MLGWSGVGVEWRWGGVVLGLERCALNREKLW